MDRGRPIIRFAEDLARSPRPISPHAAKVQALLNQASSAEMRAAVEDAKADRMAWMASVVTGGFNRMYEKTVSLITE